MTAVARLSEDGATVLLSLKLWQGSFPLPRLSSQLAFYRGLRDRKGGKYAEYYQPTVDALEALWREIGGETEKERRSPAVSPPMTASSPRRPAAHTSEHDASQFSLGL